jgi:hypothetical protein
MQATKRSLGEFATSHAVSFSAKPTDANPNTDDWEGAHHWLCVLRRHGARMSVPYSQGSAIVNPPTVEDLLSCMADDCAGYENARSFADWARDYGYDEDSRKAERIYKIIARQAASLKRLLGESAYRNLLWNTERE